MKTENHLKADEFFSGAPIVWNGAFYVLGGRVGFGTDKTIEVTDIIARLEMNEITGGLGEEQFDLMTYNLNLLFDLILSAHQKVVTSGVTSTTQTISRSLL